MFANILFDLDGTLTDPKDGITRCIRYALERLGVTAPSEDQLTWCIGPSLRASLGRLLDTRDQALIEKALTLYRSRFATVGLYENDIYPEVIPALQRIKAAGVSLFLSTAKPWVFARRILDHFDLTALFKGIYGSELDGRLSDKGELIAHILDREALAPGATLMVGDRAQDIIGGQRNGTRTAAVSYGYGSRGELTASNPDYFFDSIGELAVFIDSGGGIRSVDEDSSGHSSSCT